MKYVMLVGDGMADFPLPALQNETPLSYLSGRGELAGLDEIAGGDIGRALTCPEGTSPGSDVAFLSLLGQNPLTCYTGRSPLEAAGEGMTLGEGEISLRVNLISRPTGEMTSYNGGGIGGADALTLVNDLIRDPTFAEAMRKIGMRIQPTDTFRHIAVFPAGAASPTLTPAHDITGQKLTEHAPKGAFANELNELQELAHVFLKNHPVNAARAAAGKLAADGIWFWGPGRAAKLESFPAKFGMTGAAVTAVPLVRGIARLAGLDAPRIPGATGELDSNYAGKVEAAGRLLDDHDFVLVHAEAPDDQSHLGSVEGKIEAIRRFDARVVRPVLEVLKKRGEPFRALALPDHYTPLSTKTHDGTPIPYALLDSRAAGAPRAYRESLCEQEPVLTADELLRKLFKR